MDVSGLDVTLRCGRVQICVRASILPTLLKASALLASTSLLIPATTLLRGLGGPAAGLPHKGSIWLAHPTCVAAPAVTCRPLDGVAASV